MSGAALEPGAEIECSVVVACVESARSIEAALDALARATADGSAEIIVVDASTDDTADRAAGHPVVTEVIGHPPGTLVPELWADGIRRSRGRHVALTTGHCIVPDGWCAALAEALDGGAAGAGAGLVLRPEARMADRAVFFLRYARYLEQTVGAARTTNDVPGDNAAYEGASVRAFTASRPEGFWELDHHAQLEDAGRSLRAVPAAAAGFGRAFPFATILAHRWRHGRHHGASRVKGGQGMLRVVLPAPLVPLVLFGRAFRHAGGRPGYRARLLTSLPAFLVLAGAWAAGEAAGALLGPGAEPH